MALRFDASADRLTRSANLPSITGFTICGVSVINTDRGASTYQPLITVTPYAAAYILWGGGASHLSKMLLGSYNGSSENNIEFTSRPAVGVRFFWYIRCSGSGANLLQAGWMPFGGTSFTEQRSTTLISTPSTAAIYINGDAFGNWSNQDYNAVKVWNVALSDAELLAEAASERAVKTSGLLIDSPMTGANATAAEVDGNGWDTGGEAVGSAAVTVTTTNDAKLDGNDISVTATGGAIGPATGGVLHDGTYPLAYVAFGESKTADVGTPFNVNWSASGIITWTVA